MNMLFIYLSYFLFAFVIGKEEGETCVEQYTNVVGVCTKASQCKSAKRDFFLGGIRPTFCSYNAFEESVVCCQDGSSILNTASSVVSGSSSRSADDKRRISERKGKTCVEQYTNVVGVCTKASQCQSAKQDFFLSGIRPTFCSYNAFEESVVCCKDGSSILNTASSSDTTSGSSWHSTDDRRRVSERKCEEYSESTVHRVNYLPLQLEHQSYTTHASQCNFSSVQLIIGGKNAELGEFPHMVAIGWVDFDVDYSFKCGGSLISPRFVVTAGHCSYAPEAKQPEPVIVRLGDLNIDNSVKDEADPIEVPIRHIHKHPDYHPPIVYNDIALIELATDVSFTSFIRAACLWSQPDFAGYKEVIATGWGVVNTTTGEKSDDLKKVELSLFENNYCDTLLYNIRNTKWNGMVDTQMCAGELFGGKDTCQGDSGSPLQVVSEDNQCIFHIVGITSFGKQCAEIGRPAIYTRISSYLDWIESIVWPGEK